MNDLQVTATCAASSGDTASLDGLVTISLDGAVTTYADLADGAAEFSVEGVDASFLVVADVQCDGETPGVTYAAVGVGSVPVPVEPELVTSMPAAYASYSLPATGVDSGLLAGAALAVVLVGAGLARLARRAIA